MNDTSLDVGVPLFSASQVKNWDACRRRWALSSIAKLDRTTSAAAELGVEIDDKQLQPYLREGKPLDFTRKSGDIARTILAYLPPAGSCKGESTGLEYVAGDASTVQKRIVLPSPTGKWGYLGFIDLWTPGPPPVVVDFKSTKSIGDYALTATGLATDVQAQIYGTWALWVTRSDVVDLEWLYMQTQGPRKSKRVHLRLTSEHAAEQFQAIEARAARMFEARAALKDGDPTQALVVERVVRELPPTPSACGDFGGCPFRHVCNLSPAEYVDSLNVDALEAALTDTPTDGANDMNGNSMNLLAQLQGQATQQPAPQQAYAPPAQPPASAPAPFQASGIPGFAPQQPAPQAQPTIPIGGIYAQMAPQQQPALGINPPEAQLPAAPAIGALPPAPAEAPKRTRKSTKDPAGADAHAASSGAFDFSVETGEIVKLARALRAGCDAFLVVMGAA